MRKDVFKPIRWLLYVTALLCFAFDFVVISIGRIWPTVPDTTHTYPLSLETWGIHYTPTAIGQIFHWTWRLSFPLIAATMLLGITTEVRRRRTNDEKLNRLMRGGPPRSAQQ